MANVRIKDLTTTAATTASDDFFGVDGATNGTRKLNAYSPTFGGNLTVSGGTGTFSGSSPTLSTDGLDRAFTFTSPGAGGTMSFLAGGVNWLGASAQAYVGVFIGGNTSVNQLTISQSNSLATLGSALGFKVTNTTASTSTTTGALVVTGGVGVGGAINAGGNLTVSGTGNSSVAGTLLVATTTNSSNGKLQLADHSTSAGGIGFGTDTSWYRAAAGSLVLDHIGGSGPTANLAAGGSIKTRWFWNGSDSYFETTTAAGLIFRTNSTTALTLDSSQRTIANGAFWSSSTGNTSTNGFNNATSIANNLISLYGSTGSANIQIAGRVTTFDGGSGYYGLNLQAPTSAYPDFSGTVNWTNALTLTSQNATFAGIITTQSSGTGSGLVIKRNANPYVDFYDGGTSGTIRAEILADNDGVSGGNFKIQTRNNAGTMTLAATFDKSQNATFAGSITTSAPTGGAGAWELGVANTVSPTAPNRTITIEIGGTVYYLHAKTTND